jgi:hypothetical protein
MAPTHMRFKDQLFPSCLQLAMSCYKARAHVLRCDDKDAELMGLCAASSDVMAKYGTTGTA